MASFLASLFGRWHITCFAIAVGLFSVAGRLFDWPRAALLRGPGSDSAAHSTAAERIAEGRKRRLDARGYSRTTEDQDVEIFRTFTESIDQDAVCALAASIHGGGVPCHVVGKRGGSFNMCFFVEFDDVPPNEEGVAPTKWVVRLPIGHTVDRPWDKVVSEVATMRYIARKTRIPVARVHAYGRDGSLIRKPERDNKTDDDDDDDDKNVTHVRTEKDQVYVIMDFVPGTKLDKKVLAAADSEQRASFYSQRVDILSELRPLEFPQIGSLLPGPDRTDHAAVAIGPLLFMADNTINLPPPPVWTSAADFMEHTYEAVVDFFFAPVGDMRIDNVRRELFALDALKPIFADVTADSSNNGGAPFILNHFDLRAANMIIDEQLRIQAVIDWEFTGTVPLSLFTPPSWVVGHDDSMPDSTIHAEFRKALRARDTPLCRQLEQEWYGEVDDDDNGDGNGDLAASTIRRFSIAHILRKPSHAVDVFYEFLDDEATADENGKESRLVSYFNDHPELQVEARRRCDQSREYSTYLVENGIFESRMDRFYAMKKQLEDKLGRPLY